MYVLDDLNENWKRECSHCSGELFFEEDHSDGTFFIQCYDCNTMVYWHDHSSQCFRYLHDPNFEIDD